VSQRLPFAYGKVMVVPPDPTVKFYINDFLLPRPYEFNGWRAESMAWKTGCSMHAGLSGPLEWIYRGPQAQEFLQSVMINGLSKFPIGSAKHAIMLNEEGLVANHGVLMRHGENDFRANFSGAWPMHLIGPSRLEVQTELREVYDFQLGGPTSLQVLERATGESLRDIAFLRARTAKIADLEVEILRVGMSGTLAYEVRGPIEEGQRVHAAIEEAGREFALERMGWRTYGVNHVENGFPQIDHTFFGSGYDDPAYNEFLGGFRPTLTGSVGPDNDRARKRSPVELNWHRAARFDHDFVGRAALEKEIAAPTHTIVTLEWNVDDVAEIYRSLFEPGEEYKLLEFPSTPLPLAAFQSCDWVLKGSERVGTSTGVTYSYYYRKMISHGNLDLDQAMIGNEVVIQWGDYGKRIKEVRATVARYPYLDLEPNQTYDLSKIPSGVARSRPIS
jgi:vanillate/3-O-methylgallate O-demethylase